MTDKNISKGGQKLRHKKLDSRDIQLICMASLSVLFLAVFAYTPMAGIALAFKEGNYKINLFEALLYSEWTLDNFRSLFGDEVFWTTLPIR